jgi:hypothetical protein
MAKEWVAREQECKQSHLAMAALQQELEQTQTQNSSDGDNAPMAG